MLFNHLKADGGIHWELCVKWNDSLRSCLGWLLPDKTGDSTVALVGICLWEQNLALFSMCWECMLGIKVSCEQLIWLELKEFASKTRHKGRRMCFATYTKLRGMASPGYCLLTRHCREMKLSNKALLCAPYTGRLVCSAALRNGGMQPFTTETFWMSDSVKFITSSSYSLFNFKFSNKTFDLELRVEMNFFIKKKLVGFLK